MFQTLPVLAIWAPFATRHSYLVILRWFNHSILSCGILCCFVWLMGQFWLPVSIRLLLLLLLLTSLSIIYSILLIKTSLILFPDIYTKYAMLLSSYQYWAGSVQRVILSIAKLNDQFDHSTVVDAFSLNGTIITTNGRAKYSIHNETWPFNTDMYLNAISPAVGYTSTHMKTNTHMYTCFFCLFFQHIQRCLTQSCNGVEKNFYRIKQWYEKL